MQDIIKLPITALPSISARIKLFASMDIIEKRKPQNGRFSLDINSAKFDFRVSSMPLVDMESIVIRILSKYDIKPQLDLLGYSKSSLEIIKSAISYKSGLLLVCGATGSGKTTTLYSMLNQINDGTKKIITIEDPVEYNVSNTQQIQIEEDIGLTFELVLKNILRQDPDVIVIGEIRDKESLKIAIEASMTGHLVLATLHTNGVIESIARLFEMGMEPYFIASSLKMITSGRLVRKLCPHCKDEETKETKGCERCNYTRYNGRTIVDETVLVSKELSELILSRASQNSIQNYLLENGFKDIDKAMEEKSKNGII
jgi:type II secretory ATPase GspE/PulE/Tfp pilus assembly ATPase PilB-like protein